MRADEPALTAPRLNCQTLLVYRSLGIGIRRTIIPIANSSRFGRMGLDMKIGIVGAGRVGCACALSAVVRGSARTIVIVDRTRARAKAVATDLRYGTPLCPKTTIVDGDYKELADAA